jgi:hypothetical protein
MPPRRPEVTDIPAREPEVCPMPPVVENDVPPSTGAKLNDGRVDPIDDEERD